MKIYYQQNERECVSVPHFVYIWDWGHHENIGTTISFLQYELIILQKQQKNHAPEIKSKKM